VENPGGWDASDATEPQGRFLSKVHTAWSTVSPDGKLYAAGGYSTVGSQLVPRLFYGSLAGGSVTSFAQAQVGEDLQLVGWTTLTPAASASQSIETLWMSTATTGWARTTTHQILHTTDGGKSWQNVTPPYPAGSSVQLPRSSHRWTET
jgi:hypothetical protein